MLATTGDAMYGGTAERLVGKQAALGVPAYLYIFDHGYPAADDLGLHAFHASELPYVFGTADRTPPRWPQVTNYSADLKLSEAMPGYWASFARSALQKADRKGVVSGKSVSERVELGGRLKIKKK